MLGFINSFESFGSVDGPGIRFVVFMQGCDMRCLYCHNPETWVANTGQALSASEVIKKALRYRPYWGNNGGITVSGGEALLQIEFLTELFHEAKKYNINTCIDTSASCFTHTEPFFSQFSELMNLTDHVLLDVKHIDNDEHKKLTGRHNSNILDCAKFLSEINKPVWIRHVLVPGITDNDKYICQLRDFLSTLNNIVKIEVLPYHTLGIAKYQKLNIDYKLRDTLPPTQDRLNNANRILSEVPLCE